MYDNRSSISRMVWEFRDIMHNPSLVKTLFCSQLKESCLQSIHVNLINRTMTDYSDFLSWREVAAFVR